MDKFTSAAAELFASDSPDEWRARYEKAHAALQIIQRERNEAKARVAALTAALREITALTCPCVGTFHDPMCYVLTAQHALDAAGA